MGPDDWHSVHLTIHTHTATTSHYNLHLASHRHLGFDGSFPGLDGSTSVFFLQLFCQKKPLQVFLRPDVLHVKAQKRTQRIDPQPPSALSFLESPLDSSHKQSVKAFHTRYQALGPELIPVYRQSACRWLSHPPSGRLPLLSARPAVTFPAAQHHRPLADTNLRCLVTEAHRYELTCPRLLNSFCPE